MCLIFLSIALCTFSKSTIQIEKLINKIVINQVISYWPSYRSSASCIGPVTGSIRNYFINIIIVAVAVLCRTVLVKTVLGLRAVLGNSHEQFEVLCYSESLEALNSSSEVLQRGSDKQSEPVWRGRTTQE